jgi:glyoxylase-like metal-dependent hydrolase (beta-lactamase superfamily II)
MFTTSRWSYWLTSRDIPAHSPGDGGDADDLTPFMLDVMPRELASGLWCWTAPHPDWRPDRGGVGGWDRNVGSWLLEEDDRVVLIDPLLPDDHSLLRRLDERIGGRTVDVLITCTGHLRSAEAVHERYGATVWGNAKTREDVEQLVTGLIVDGVSLPAGIIPYTPIPNDAEEDETAFWLPPQRALAVGDILIHTPEGLRIWWTQNTEALRAEYRERVQPALRRLRELPVELILVPHGAPITTNARQALQQALEADTWQRP